VVPAGDCGLGRDSKAQAEWVRSVSVSRLGGVIGQLTPALVEELDGALRLHLGL
jgi:mRNA interferase MazF